MRGGLITTTTKATNSQVCFFQARFNSVFIDGFQSYFLDGGRGGEGGFI